MTVTPNTFSLFNYVVIHKWALVFSPFVVICVVIVAIIVPSALVRCNVNRREKVKKLCCCVFVHTEDDASVCDMTGSFAT